MKWPEVEIRQVAEVASGFGFPRKHQGNTDHEFPFFKVGDMNLTGNERCMTVTINTISNETLKKLGAKTFPKGTIIFPKIGAAIATNKKRILTQPSVVDNNVMGLIPNHHIDAWYLYYWMQKFDLRSVSNIGPVPSMRKTEVEKVLIPLPSLSEQRRIVEILDHADALRTKRAEGDRKAARIQPALLHKMFGDPATNPMGWPITTMDEVIADTRNGIYKPTSYYGRGVQILKMFNIQNGELYLNRVDLIDVNEDEYQTYSLLPGDILLNRVNTPELVGKCAVITEAVGKAVFESKNIRIRLNSTKIHYEYVAAYLNSPFGHASLRSGVKHAIGMATINNTDLRAVKIPLPPMAVQESWANAARSQRTLENARIASKRQIDSLFSVLLHRAFSGNLTAKWREAHMKELLAEMKLQAKSLDMVSASA